MYGRMNILACVHMAIRGCMYVNASVCKSISVCMHAPVHVCRNVLPATFKIQFKSKMTLYSVHNTT